jgi:hypothetical protein
MQFKPHTLVSLAGIVVSILAGGARAQDDTTDSPPAADICFVAKADTLPNAAVAAAGDVTRIDSRRSQDSTRIHNHLKGNHRLQR